MRCVGELDARLCYASLLGDAGLPDHDIQLRLGHAHPGDVR